MKPAFAPAAAAVLFAAAFTVPATALTLYDPGAGTLPAAQGWLTSTLGPGLAGTQAVSGGLLSFDSTAAGVGVYGNLRTSPVALDAAAGYTVDFSLQLLSESHASANRAGFSLVLVGHDPRQSLELSFWGDRVWAADYVALDPDRFVQGPGAAFDTTAALTDYRLRVQGDGYALSAGGRLLFTGALQDYRAQGQPYTLADAVFFGDDSSRGSASLRLGALAVSPVPEPSTAAMLLAGGGLLLAAARRRRR